MNAVLECLRRDHGIPRGIFRLIVEEVRPRCPGVPPPAFFFLMRHDGREDYAHGYVMRGRCVWLIGPDSLISVCSWCLNHCLPHYVQSSRGLCLNCNVAYEKTMSVAFYPFVEQGTEEWHELR